MSRSGRISVLVSLAGGSALRNLRDRPSLARSASLVASGVADLPCSHLYLSTIKPDYPLQYSLHKHRQYHACLYRSSV